MQFRWQWHRFAMLATLAIVIPQDHLHAQDRSLPTGDLDGIVVAQQGGAPIGGVRIGVLGTSRSAISGKDGRFHLAALAPGAIRVITQHLAYAPDTATVTIMAGRAAEVRFALQEAATVLQPLIISATREVERRSEGSLTIDALSGEQVRQTRAAHPAGLLNQLAGVHVTETSGEGHMMAMRLQVTTAPMYLYLEDGIPTRATGFFNHNALYEVNLPQSGGIEVIKGPGSALYGSDAIGGIVNVMTRPASLTPSVDLNVEGGANGYRRLLASVSGTAGVHGLRADVNVTHSDNWKELAPFDRQSGTIRWDASFGGWNARTVIAGSRIDQQDVPAVSFGIYDTAATVNLAPIAYRTVRSFRASTAFERESGNALLSFTPYARINEMGLLPSWQLSYDPQTWETRNTSLGFLARYRRDIAPGNGRIILGLDGDLSPGSYLARQAVVTRGGPYNAWISFTDGATHYDYDATYKALSPYLQTHWNPVGPLRIDAGVRADFAGYDYETRLAPVATGNHRVPANTSVSYSHLSPKVGATYAFSDHLNVYGSYRHGFRVPSFGQLFTQNSAENTVNLRPVTVDSWEAGVRGEFSRRVVYQVAGYTMDVDNDIMTFVTAQNTREARNAGSARHRGLEASLGLLLAKPVRLDLAYSVASHRYLEWTPQAAKPNAPEVSYSGNLIEQAPRTIGSAMLAWTPSLLGGGRVAVEWSHLGRYAQDAANTSFYAGHNLVNVHANAFIFARTELFLRLTNLADTRYAELSSYDAFQRDTYTPGAPRALFAGARHVW